MRSADEAYEDIEEDRAVREAEVRLIERYYNAAVSANERTMLARSLVLLTYAHVEGFTKFALQTYISVINGMKIPCYKATLPLAAATLSSVFAALRDVNARHSVFRDLPSDHDIHLQQRNVDFIEKYDTIMAQVVDIPDSAIEAATNLNSRMLKRALFKMGLSLPELEPYHGTIDRLLGERNAIAHGDRIHVPKPEAIADYLHTTFKLMLLIQQEIYGALNDETYYRPAANDS